jgi:hypothetical protein
MADRYEEEIDEPMTGTAPTGADLTSDGSSVETTEDVATLEEIPSVDEITGKGRKKKDAGEGTGDLPYKHPAPPHAPSGGAAGGAASQDTTRE